MKTNHQRKNTLVSLFRYKKIIIIFMLFMLLIAGKTTYDSILITCTKNEDKTRLVNIETIAAQPEALYVIELEFEKLVKHIIQHKINVDSLQFYFYSNNFSRIHFLLGYTEEEATEELQYLTTLSSRALQQQKLTDVSPPNHLKPILIVFESLKKIQREGLGGIRNLRRRYFFNRIHIPQFTRQLTLNYASGIRSGGILGIVGILDVYTIKRKTN